MQSEQINELSKALALAQGSMKAAVYNRINPHFKSKYADLAAVWDAIREPLAKNGLSITQTLRPLDGVMFLDTTLRHASGQWVESVYPLPSGATPQNFGSALTYARRYSLSCITGIAADDDDDANAAQEQTGKIAPPKKKLSTEMKDSIPDQKPEPYKPGSDGMSLEDMAREAAQHGRDQFNMFFARRTGEEQEKLRAMKTELIALFPKQTA